MKPTIRVKLGLLAIASLMLAAFTWSAAQGQFRPPGFRRPIGPRMNQPGGMGIGWRCPKCNQTGPGAIPPRTCPGCGITFINGMGNGSAGGIMGNPRGNPPMNPGFNPPMNPGFNPPMNPPAPLPNQPVNQMPPANNTPQPGLNSGGNPNPVGQPVPAADSSNSTSSTSSASESKPSSRKWVLPVVIGIVVLGIFVLLGGTFLVIYTVRNSGSAPAKRRRRRRDDDD